MSEISLTDGVKKYEMQKQGEITLRIEKCGYSFSAFIDVSNETKIVEIIVNIKCIKKVY